MRTHIMADNQFTFCGLIGRGAHATVYAAEQYEINTKEKAERAQMCKRCAALWLRRLPAREPVTAASDPMPPFPQDPAFNSSEAAVLRRCGSCGGRGYVPDEEAGSRACRDCNADGHLPTFPDAPSQDDLLARRDALQAEVERLKTENETLRRMHLEAEEGLRDQRNALADALEAFASQACTCNDCLTARAALRLVGRLPVTPV